MEDNYEDTAPTSKINFPTVDWLCPSVSTIKRVKKRGRPKKNLPQVEGVTVHKSDNDPVFKILSSAERTKIERSFQDRQNLCPTRTLIEELSKEFSIPYRQVYDITAKFF